ncbi:serine hydrolase [Paractinoplanes deccanensis]|uniref:Serine hydrolase n=1 Tax=Paractinoplanes deccanensis TaxID=113561 RepID=A0ABQ3Y849_9ACTN|nr:serine hydrolase [Actinoplanes deccanensis]GID76156.1 serine hydrolase [Actinoplanes deccanensis]
MRGFFTELSVTGSACAAPLPDDPATGATTTGDPRSGDPASGGTTIGGTAIGGTAIGGTAIGGTARSGAAVGGTAVGGTAVGGTAVGVDEHAPMTPGSVMKIQVGLAAARLMAAGELDGTQQRVLTPAGRTPGPAGISLMRDEVRMSVRDLVTLMMTISDNVATDELIALVGLDRVNALTASLGLEGTRVTADLGTMLDDMAAEVGFPTYEALLGSAVTGDDLAGTAALDPTRGSRTTAADTVRLLQAVWADPSADALRRAMGDQLVRCRIASGFGPEVRVAAKSGGLMGVVRNEAAVVTYPDGRAYAVAVFTRRPRGVTVDPARVDAGIGRIARSLVDQLRAP